MVLINASELKKEFGTRVLFEKASFTVDSNDKIGFVGANGTGKTTLFKIITGEISSDGGELFKSRDTKIGYMQQHSQMNTEKTLIAEVMSIFKPLIDIENRLKSIESMISNGVGELDKLTDEQYRLNEEYEKNGGFLYKNKVKASLLGLGFNESDFETDFSALSGGQQTRVILCKLLLGSSNLLLLDEPTNHLDIESTEWLEGFLREYDGSFIVISHDRYFLDRVTNKTFELDNNRLTVYNGSYTSYMQQKEERMKSIERKYENVTKEISRIEGIIEQQKRWNREKNIKTAESKQKQINRLEQGLEIPEYARENIRFLFKAEKTGPNEVVRCRSLKMGYDGNVLFCDTDIDINRGDRVFLLGKNGCGKTTLFRLITGDTHPIEGSIKIGTGVNMGYYDQKQQNLCMDKEAYDEISDSYPYMTQTEIRNAMATLLFKNDDVFKLIRELSGGERARIALIKLMLSGANFLIMDEPTNHLDIKSREALENALLDYDGTMFVISHDRYFINRLANKIYYMGDRGVHLYNGDYTYYCQKRTDTVENNPADKKPSTSKMDYAAKKQFESELRKVKNAIKNIEEKIDECENTISELTNMLMKEEVATDFEKSMEISKKIDIEKKESEELYEKWEELSQRLCDLQE